MAERTKIMVDVLLDCGCWVSHGLASPHGLDTIGKTLHLASDILPHHFDKAEVAHKCHLVTEDNPNGDSKAH